MSGGHPSEFVGREIELAAVAAAYARTPMMSVPLQLIAMLDPIAREEA
jgi:hypothetical protein